MRDMDAVPCGKESFLRSFRVDRLRSKSIVAGVAALAGADERPKKRLVSFKSGFGFRKCRILVAGGGLRASCGRDMPRNKR